MCFTKCWTLSQFPPQGSIKHIWFWSSFWLVNDWTLCGRCLWPMNQFTWGIIQAGVLGGISQLSRPLVALFPNLFEPCRWHQIQKTHIIFQSCFQQRRLCFCFTAKQHEAKTERSALKCDTTISETLISKCEKWSQNVAEPSSHQGCLLPALRGEIRNRFLVLRVYLYSTFTS